LYLSFRYNDIESFWSLFVFSHRVFSVHKPLIVPHCLGSIRSPNPWLY
jgi:hypothetical protein